MSDESAPPICERCWQPCLPGEQFARLGSIRHATLRGDIEWDYTYLHAYDRVEGCVTGREAAA